MDLDARGRPIGGHVVMRLWDVEDDPARAVPSQLLFTFVDHTSARDDTGTAP